MPLSVHSLLALTLLSGLGGLGLVLALDLARRLFWTARTPTPRLLAALEPLLAEGRWNEAALECACFRGAPARLIRAGLEHWEKGPRAIEEAVDQAGEVEHRVLGRGLGWLGLIANLAPMVGFVGSMTPMFRSFDVIALQGLNNPVQAAAGILEALTLIGAGLAVAIPSLAIFNLLHVELGKYVGEFEAISRFLSERHRPPRPT